jgi:hypothetical protein
MQQMTVKAVGNEEGRESRESQISLAQPSAPGKENRMRATYDVSDFVALALAEKRRYQLANLPNRDKKKRGQECPRHRLLVLLFAQLLEEQTDRFDPTIEVRNMELLVGSVQIVVG